jgi:predicted amidophosphoribosyltransferase
LAIQQSGGSGRAPDIKVEDVVRRFETFRKLIVACNECQSEMSVNWQYCTNCGTRLSTECPGCHQPLPPAGAKFCPHCGMSIPEVGA